MSHAGSWAESRRSRAVHTHRRSAFDSFDESQWLYGLRKHVRSVLLERRRPLSRDQAPPSTPPLIRARHQAPGIVASDHEEEAPESIPEDQEAKSHLRLAADAMKELLALGGVVDEESEQPVEMDGFAEKVWRVDEPQEGPSSLFSLFQTQSNGPVDVDALLRFRAGLTEAQAEEEAMPPPRPKIEVVESDASASSATSDSDDDEGNGDPAEDNAMEADEDEDHEGENDSQDDDNDDDGDNDNAMGDSPRQGNAPPFLRDLVHAASTHSYEDTEQATPAEPLLPGQGGQHAPIVVLSDSEEEEEEEKETTSPLSSPKLWAYAVGDALPEGNSNAEDEEEDDGENMLAEGNMLEKEKEEEEEEEDNMLAEQEEEEHMLEDENERGNDEFGLSQANPEPTAHMEMPASLIADASPFTEEEPALHPSLPINEASETRTNLTEVMDEDIITTSLLPTSETAENTSNVTTSAEATTAPRSELVIELPTYERDETSGPSSMTDPVLVSETPATDAQPSHVSFMDLLASQDEPTMIGPSLLSVQADASRVSSADAAMNQVTTASDGALSKHPDTSEAHVTYPTSQGKDEPAELAMQPSPDWDVSDASTKALNEDEEADTSNLLEQPDEHDIMFSSPSQHATRSHCAFQRLTLTNEDGAPTFIVRSCTLNPTVLEEEGAEQTDVITDSLEMQQLDADSLPESVYHALCRIVGSALLDDVYVLPQSLGAQWMKTDPEHADIEASPSKRPRTNTPSPPRRMRLRTAQERRRRQPFSPS